MNSSKFDTIVENRAAERVRARIRKFEYALLAELRELSGRSIDNSSLPELFNGEIFVGILVGLQTRKWPKYLWEQEREKVANELLSVMDEMQKALLAPQAIADGQLPAPWEEGTDPVVYRNLGGE